MVDGKIVNKWWMGSQRREGGNFFSAFWDEILNMVPKTSLFAWPNRCHSRQSALAYVARNRGMLTDGATTTGMPSAAHPAIFYEEW
jgi:hypothetical protein